jgi:hypothetical protein
MRLLMEAREGGDGFGFGFDSPTEPMDEGTPFA